MTKLRAALVLAAVAIVLVISTRASSDNSRWAVGVSDGDKGDVTVSGGGATWGIDSDAVTEADLKSVNGPTDEYCLTYESTAGDFEWQTCGSGGVSDGDKGDITVSGGGSSWQIDAYAVGDAELRGSIGNSVIGRAASGGGSPADIIALDNGDVLRLAGGTLGFGAIDLTDADAVTGALPFGNGGTGLSAAADDTAMLSSGSSWVATAIPDCDDSGGNHLNYDAGTNAFSCGTSSSGGGGANKGSAIVDFGAFPGSADATVTVTGQTSILSGSVVMVQVRPDATADHSADEHLVTPMRCIPKNIVAGTGFTIHCFYDANPHQDKPQMQSGLPASRIGLADGKGVTLPQVDDDSNANRIHGQWTVGWAWF